MATFTTVQNGNINDGGTFGNTSPGVAGTDYPDSSGGDTAVIVDQKNLTIPSSYDATATILIYGGSNEANAGTLTLGSGSSLTLEGDLVFSYDISAGRHSKIVMGAGSQIDLNGNDIVLKDNGASYNYWSINGTVNSRANIIDSLGGGSITTPEVGGGFAHADVDWNYCDFIGFTEIQLGTSVAANQAIYIDHCTFDGGDVRLMKNYGVAGSVTVQNNDFRNTSGANKYMLLFGGHADVAAEGTVRLIDHNTFSSPTVDEMYIRIFGSSVTFQNNVVDNVGVEQYQGTTGLMVYDNLFSVYNTVSTIDSLIVMGNSQIKRNYFYLNKANAHLINMDDSAEATGTFEDNVIENISTTGDGPDYIFAKTQITWSIQNNLVIEFAVDGVLFNALTDTSTKSHTVQNNTIYTNTDDDYGTLIRNENGGQFGGMNVYNNLVVGRTEGGIGVNLVNTAANQITNVDYNCFHKISDFYFGVSITGKTEGVTTGFGRYDLYADPQFTYLRADLIDYTKTLTSGDTTLQSIGRAMAIFRLINGYDTNSQNSANIPTQTVSTLKSYVEAGFVPRNPSLLTSGNGGTFIGFIEPNPILLAKSPDVVVHKVATSYTYSCPMCKSVKYANTLYMVGRITPAAGFDGHNHMKSTWVVFWKSTDMGKTWTQISIILPPDETVDSIASGISCGMNSAGQEVIFALVGKNTTALANVRAPICVMYSYDQGENWSEFYDMTEGDWPLIPGGVCISYDGAPFSSTNVVLSNGIVFFRLYNHRDLIDGCWQFYTIRCHIDGIETAANWVCSKGYTDGYYSKISEAANCEIKTNGAFEGGVLSVVREESTLDIYKQVSYDYGLTWTTQTPMRLYRTVDDYSYPPSILRLSNDKLIILAGRQVITVWISSDEGGTWTQLEDFINYPVKGSCSYQSVVEINPHWLCISWANVGRGDSEGWISFQHCNYHYLKY